MSDFSFSQLTNPPVSQSPLFHTSIQQRHSSFMPQFWIAIFFILLAATELYQSIKDINLPFPVYLVLGTILAVAANSQRQFSFTQDRQVTLTAIKAADSALGAVPAPILTAIDDKDLDA